MLKVFHLGVTTGYVQYAFVCESLSWTKNQERLGAKQGQTRSSERTDGRLKVHESTELNSMTDGRLWLLMNPGAQKRRTRLVTRRFPEHTQRTTAQILRELGIPRGLTVRYSDSCDPCGSQLHGKKFVWWKRKHVFANLRWIWKHFLRFWRCRKWKQ